jgi:Rod binding domain-containing protein
MSAPSSSPLPGLRPDAQMLMGTRPTKSFNVNNAKDIAALKKVGHEFEAMFLSQMVGHMFAGIKSGGPFGGGHAEETYRSLLVDEYGRAIAKSGGIGIADQIVRSVMLQFQEASSNVQPRRSPE